MIPAGRLAGWLLLALLFAPSGRAVPAPPVGASATAAAAPQLADTATYTIQPGLPGLGSGPLLPRLAGQQSGVRLPLRSPHGAAAAQHQAVETSRARIRLAMQCAHAQPLADLRRNLPATYGNPPPASLS